MTSPHQQNRTSAPASSLPAQARAPRPGASRPRRGPATAAALAALLLLLVVVGSALSGPWQVTEPDPVPVTMAPLEEITATPSPEPTPEDFLQERENQGDGASTVLMVILGILLLAAIVAAVRKVVRRRLPPWHRGEKEPDPVVGDGASAIIAVVPVAALEEAAGLAAQRLRASTDPTDDVVAAWVALERAAEESGTARTPAQTPTEFTVAVLGTTSARPADVQTLLRLYHRARFTEHRITPAEGATAADALERLVEDLRSSGSAENGGPGGQAGAGGPAGPGGAGGPGRPARRPAPGGQSPARRSTEDGA